MIIGSSQFAIWLLIVLVPNVAMSRAWLEFLEAKLGGRDAMHRYAGGMPFRRGGPSVFEPRLLEFTVRSQPTSELAMLQRRWQIRVLALLVVAVVGWFVAGWIAPYVPLNEGQLRIVQVAFLGTLFVWATREVLRPAGSRLWPTAPLVLGGMLRGAIGVIFAILVPAT